jgi:hypothetical protein
MKAKSHVDRLRAIRDAVSQELEQDSWEAWESKARAEVEQHPSLAEMLAEAVPPESVETGGPRDE